MYRYSALALYLLLLGWPPSSAAEENGVARLKEKPFRESYHNEAPVSGRVIAGVLLQVSGSPGLALLPPASAAGKSACVQVMSRDGRYASKNTFLIPTGADLQTIELEYPSAHEDFLSQLGSDGLAILASAGDCSDTDPSMLYLSASRSGPEPTGEGTTITILVNSGRSDTFVAVKNDPKGRRPTRCREIEEGRRTGFDKICTIDLSKLDSRPETLEVRILRRQYERTLPPTEFKVALPPAR